jgi:hypothetical protein
MIEAFPLSWPHDWPRAKHRRHSPYKVSLDVALEELLGGLRLMGARAIIVSSNVPLRRDGTMYRDHSARVHDPGIAAYWDAKDGTPKNMACDCWVSVRENVRAIGLAIDGLRLIERTGASQLFERAFTGFARLPSGSERKPWWEVLGVDPKATQAIIQDSYRRLALQNHPDRGGLSARMAEINHAYQEALDQR